MLGGGAREIPRKDAFPELCIFDLDYTLWPLDVDTHVSVPFTRTSGTGVLDAYGTRIDLYADVRRVLQTLREAGVAIAFASRTTDPAAAEALLRAMPLHDAPSQTLALWDVLPSPHFFQAYPSGGSGCKTRHFAAIRAASGTAPADMLFFDDMKDNVDAARMGGVTSVHLSRSGLTWAAFQRGLQEWRKSRSC